MNDNDGQFDATQIVARWTSDPVGSLIQLVEDALKGAPELSGFGIMTVACAQFDRSAAKAIAATIHSLAARFSGDIQHPPSYNAQVTAMHLGALHLAPWSVIATLIHESPNPVVDAVRATLYVAESAQRNDLASGTTPTFLPAAIRGKGGMLSGAMEIAWTADEDGSFSITIDFLRSEKPGDRFLRQSWQAAAAEAVSRLAPRARAEEQSGEIARLHVRGAIEQILETVEAVQTMRMKMIASFVRELESRAIAAPLN